MTYDPVAGVFINFSVEVPGGNVVLEVRGGSRQLRKQNGCVYELNYPKDFHSCDPDDPCVHVCGLNAQFHCTVQDCRTFTRQRIDSVNGHRLLELLSTRFLVCCDTASAISPAFFLIRKVLGLRAFWVFQSLCKKTPNLGTLVVLLMLVVGFMSKNQLQMSCRTDLSATRSSQDCCHQIPLGPL